MAGAATHLEHLCAVRGNRGDIGRDVFVERAEYQSTQAVVGDSIPDENSPRHRSPRRGRAAVPHDSHDQACRAKQDPDCANSKPHSPMRSMLATDMESGSVLTLTVLTARDDFGT